MGSRRRDQRVKINEEFDSFDQFMNEYVSDISAGGAFIRTRTPLPQGTLVELRFTVLADDVKVLEGEGEVVRVSTEPGGMGVRFTYLSDSSLQLLDDLLAGRLTRDDPESILSNPKPAPVPSPRTTLSGAETELGAEAEAGDDPEPA